MAATGPSPLTGIHKRLLADFVVLELVAHAAAWAGSDGDESYDEDAASTWAESCA